MARTIIVGLGFFLLAAAGCGGATDHPAPTAPASAVVQIAAPQLVAPANGAELLPTAPLVLTLGNERH